MRSNRKLTSSLTMWSILLFLGSILMGGGVFAVTQAAKQHETGIEEINRSLLAERQSIRVLEAEWAYLSRPQRLEELMAMKQDQTMVPPTPAPITMAPDEVPIAQADIQAAEDAVKNVEPAAGPAIELAKPEVVKKEQPVKEKPIKQASVKKEASKAKETVKTAQVKPKKSAPQTAKYDGAWKIQKKASTKTASYRSAPSVGHGTMRPIVE
ncbi:MAG TPA: hypothetical protein VIN59_00900 [Alphaproteobacteria bacterium]